MRPIEITCTLLCILSTHLQPTPVAGQGGAPKESAELRIVRRLDKTEDDLRKELARVPEVGLTQDGAASLYKHFQELIKRTDDVRPDIGSQYFRQFVSKNGLTSLPWKPAEEATASPEDARALDRLSVRLRENLMQAARDTRPDADKVRTVLRTEQAGETAPEEWTRPQAVPTLVQLLQTEHTELRLLLVEVLAGIEGKEAGAALAQRALFDLSADVRGQAVRTLARRPADEYWQPIAAGLRYPWPAAADHAAEAIVALKLTAHLPDLVRLLNEPDPRLAYPGEKKGHRIDEVVRLSHLTNCMLCHAPSLSQSDLSRGRVPIPGEAPPPLYYRNRTGTFVRASTTFLRQDFSVVQMVSSPGKWPADQRFDYILRTRDATAAEVRTAAASKWAPRTDLTDTDFGGAIKPKTPADAKPKAEVQPYREAVLFALRQLTGHDAGTTFDQWDRYLRDRQK